MGAGGRYLWNRGRRGADDAVEGTPCPLCLLAVDCELVGRVKPDQQKGGLKKSDSVDTEEDGLGSDHEDRESGEGNIAREKREWTREASGSCL